MAQSEKVVAFAPAFEFHVVTESTRVDRASWDYISQNGTEEEVLGFLEENNLEQVERFSVLLLSDEHGATVREAEPPKR